MVLAGVFIAVNILHVCDRVWSPVLLQCGISLLRSHQAPPAWHPAHTDLCIKVLGGTRPTLATLGATMYF